MAVKYGCHALNLTSAIPYLGTDRLGRPLTESEKHELVRLLRAHDWKRARTIALRFACRLMRNAQGGEELVGRASLRLVRGGWDPREVPLTKRLCRLVWSEWTHYLEQSDRARQAESVFLADQRLEVPDVAPSPEALHASLAEDRDRQARDQRRLDRLRASFEAAGDEVNLVWLALTERGLTDLKDMARESGRDVTEFYRAADRRKRHVKRLIAEEQGVEYEEGDREK
jgi:hypothetical protein